jgi:hypothetical protein
MNEVKRYLRLEIDDGALASLDEPSGMCFIN